MGGQASKGKPKQLSSLPTFSSQRSNSISSFPPCDSQSQPPQDADLNIKRPRRSRLDTFTKRNQTLPIDFSNHLMECEMELEKDDLTFDSILKLVDMYIAAMSFYEANHCPKYKYFGKKLRDLVMKPKIEEIITREALKDSKKDVEKDLRRLRLESLASEVNIDLEAFVLVKSYEDKEKEIMRVLEGDLSVQKYRIKRRMTERKSRSASLNQSTAYASEALSRTDENIPVSEKEVDGSFKESIIDEEGFIQEV